MLIIFIDCQTLNSYLLREIKHPSEVFSIFFSFPDLSRLSCSLEECDETSLGETTCQRQFSPLEQLLRIVTALFVENFLLLLWLVPLSIDVYLAVTLGLQKYRNIWFFKQLLLKIWYYQSNVLFTIYLSLSENNTIHVLHVLL